MRVLDEKGKQIGLFTRQEALRKAQEMGLDLVEIASKAQPPVAKIIDFKKFKYLEAKKEQQIKKKSKEVETKEIHLRPFIGSHDLETRAKRAIEFIKDGHRLKIVVKFQGREIAKKDFGYKVLDNFCQAVKDFAQPQVNPRWEGKFLILLMNAKRTEYAKDENKKNSVKTV